MSPETESAYSLMLVVVAICVAIGLLPVLWMREQVKKDLYGRGLRPIHVRWRPFAYWSPHMAGGFSVLYADLFGARHTERCWITPTSCRVQWVSEDVGYLLSGMPAIGQFVYLLICLFLMQLGLRGVLNGELVLPSQHAYGSNIRVHGLPLNLFCSAAFCGAASILTVLIYQYCSRDRERSFTLVARGFSILGWTLFVTSIGALCWQRLPR